MLINLEYIKCLRKKYYNNEARYNRYHTNANYYKKNVYHNVKNYDNIYKKLYTKKGVARLQQSLISSNAQNVKYVLKTQISNMRYSTYRS